MSSKFALVIGAFVALSLLFSPAYAKNNSSGAFAAGPLANAPSQLHTAANPAPLMMAESGAGVPNRYIVVLRSDRVFSASAVNAKAAQAEKQLGATVHFVYSAALNGYAATLSEAALQFLRADADVAFIEQDQVYRVVDTQNNPTWGLDRIDQRNLPLDAQYTYAMTGLNVHAYIIDTGIRSSHVEFSGRVGAGYDVIDGGAPDDCNGHGTHVAGTIGGTTYGIAKQVTLHGVRVLDCGGSGYTTGVVAGIDWVTANHIKPAVANMSLGGGASASLDTALANSVAAGVVHVVAAGNENADACLGSPAREPQAITVGAVSNSDQRASFSNYGTCLDIFAPGVDILSAWYTSDSATGTASGTSMASPHAAGVVALFLQGAPTASPSDVVNSMINAATANLVGNPGTGSPNRLLYATLGAPPTATPTVTGTPPTATPTFTPTSTPVPPANDDFAQAIAVTPLPFSQSMDTSAATLAADDPTLCTNGTGGATVWYRLLAPSAGTLTISTAGSSYDTVLAVFSGARGALTQLACNDDYNYYLQSQVTFAVTAGATYFIEVADYYVGNSSAVKPAADGNGAPIGARHGGTLSLTAVFVAAATPTATATPTRTALPPTATPTPTALSTAMPTPTALATVSAVLALAPALATAELGQTVTIEIRIRSAQLVDGVAAHVDFNPAILQVASIVPGSALPTVLQNQVDNLQGRLDFVAGALSAPFPTSDFVLATVVFTATELTSGTPITFATANPRQSVVTYNGNVILKHVENGTVIVRQGILVGRVTPPGRPAAPDISWRIPVTITKQRLPDGATVEIGATLDASGYFTLSGLSGAYQIGVRGHNTLRATMAVTLTGDVKTVDFGLLRGGDGNGDNAVTLVDFSLLVATFGICSGNTGYNGRIDFNGDDCITLLDFSILRRNFGISGDSAPRSVAQQPTAAQKVHMSIGLPATPSQINDRFTAHLWVDAGSLAMDGAAAYLNFDPAIVQVVEIRAGSVLPITLQKGFDNQMGRIEFAAGELSALQPGNFELAAIEFVAVGSGQSQLAFQHNLPAQSTITYNGESLPVVTVDGSLIVGGGMTISLYLPTITSR